MRKGTRVTIQRAPYIVVAHAKGEAHFWARHELNDSLTSCHRLEAIDAPPLQTAKTAETIALARTPKDALDTTNYQWED